MIVRHKHIHSVEKSKIWHSSEYSPKSRKTVLPVGNGGWEAAFLFFIESAFGIAVTEVTWRKPGDFFKGIGKVVWVGVADVVANLRDRVVGLT